MGEKTEPRMLASAASPAESSRSARPLPAPAASPPAAAAPVRPAAPTSPTAESEWAQGRTCEPILRPTRGANGKVATRFLPPTLYNLTHLREGDQVTQGNRHFRTLDPVDDILRRKLERTRPGTGVFSDLQIIWSEPSMERSSPDVFVVFDLERPPEEFGNSFDVAEEGVVPCLIFEIVSGTYKDTRDKDYELNPAHYARAGVKELVLVEPVTQGSPEIDILVGYRLGAGGTYEEIEPDASDRILLETVGFRVHVEQASVVLEDAQTGERFLTSQEEEDARKAAEAEVSRLREELDRLRGRSV